MSVALSRDGLVRFGEIAAAHVGPEQVPGLVALVARGDSVHVETHGVLTLGGAPIRRDSLFRIASTSKPITGALVLALAGDGAFDLDEPVDRLLPELAAPRVLRRMDGPLTDTVAAERPITVRDLLTFTGGFGMCLEMFTAPEPWPVVEAADRAGLATLGPPDPAVQPDPDTWLAALGALPLMTQPGERWLYNTGAQVLGVLASRAAGAPLPDVLRTRLLEPLAMTDTGFWTDQPARLATAYQPRPSGLQVTDPPDGVWSRPPSFGDAAAGLLSTADDLLAFARMLLRGGDPVLAAPAAAAMCRDQLTAAQRAGSEPFLSGRSWGYCQSVITDGPHTGAFGWDGGLGTSWLVDPVADLTVVVLTQRQFETPVPPAVHRELQDAAYAAVAR